MASKDGIALILAGGAGTRLRGLTASLAKPLMSFGGENRLIDFPLSNCKNSGIDTVGVLVQYGAERLQRYLADGAAWGFAEADDCAGGLRVLPPSPVAVGNGGYIGTADAVYQNIAYIETYNPKHVLILAADHVYQMDYRAFLAFHENSEADLSLAVSPVDEVAAKRLGMVNADAAGLVQGFSEKSPDAHAGLASMGIYIFRTEVLLAALRKDAADASSGHDFGADVIPRLLAEGKRLCAYTFPGYWRDAGTVNAFYRASMDVLDGVTSWRGEDGTSPIYTNCMTLSAPNFLPTAEVFDSYVGRGCVVAGTVRHSIVSAGARVEVGAVVEDAVLLPSVTIGAGTHISRVIVGEETVVYPGVSVLFPQDNLEIGVIADDFGQPCGDGARG